MDGQETSNSLKNFCGSLTEFSLRYAHVSLNVNMK